MNRPPAASTAPAWFATAAPVNVAGAVVVGPTGVAVAEPPLVEGAAAVVTVRLPAGIEEPPVGAETVEIKVEAVVTVVVGIQSGRVKVPLKLPEPPYTMQFLEHAA